MVVAVERGVGLQSGRQEGIPPEVPGTDKSSQGESRGGNELLILVSAPLVAEDLSPVEGLSIQREVDEIVSVVENLQEPFGVRITVKIATTETLLEAFSNQFTPQVIHFIGHGMPTDQGIALVLEDAVGRVRLLSADELKDLLRHRNEPPCTLAVLNACHSEGLATVFLEAGVSHVIAVNAADPILDTAARCFAKQFYQGIFNHYSVMDAFLQSRTAIKVNDELIQLINPETWETDVSVTEAIKFQLLPGHSRAHQDPLPLQRYAGKVIAPQWSNTNLPSDDPTFVGRRVDLHTLAVDLAAESANRCIALHGMGGMGKTALALAVGRWQHERRRWKAGVWLVKLRGVETIAEAIPRIRDALELNLTSLSVSKLVQALINQNLLLILDDLDTLLEKDESELIEFLNALSACRRLGLLVTSRLNLPQEVFYQQREVQGMGEDALQVFKRYAPPVEQWGIDATQVDIDQLLEYLDGYPFAIRLAGAYMRGTRCTLRELCEALQSNLCDTLKPISRKENRDNSLSATLELSYQVLPPDARTAFSLLSLFPCGLTPELLKVLTGKDGLRTLAVLLEFSMAEKSESSSSRRVTLPEPARYYAESKLEADINDVMLKSLEYFYSFAQQVRATFIQNQPQEGKRLLLEESANLNRCLRWGYEQENTKDRICYSARITTLLALHWQWISPGGDPLDSLNLAQTVAERNQDLIGQAEVQKSIGDIQSKTKGLQIAQFAYKRSIQCYELAIQCLTLPVEIADIHCKVAEIWQLCQKSHQAIDSYQTAFEIYQVEGEGQLAAQIQILIGQFQEAEENFETALANYQCAKELYATHNDLVGVRNAEALIARTEIIASTSRFEFSIATVNHQGQVTERKNCFARCFIEILPGQVPLELVLIPAGNFWMGQTDSEKEEIISQIGEEKYQDWYSYELPRHQVNVSSFFMGKFPVTQAQYEAIMGNNPATEYGKKFVAFDKPVVGVSWEDAIAFCQRLSEQTGKEYRLPSEAEWEYACRANTETPFYFGKTITTELVNYRGADLEFKGSTFLGNYGNGPQGGFREETTTVDSFPANAFGLFDMHGNVWEWCLDYWHENYQGAPAHGRAWIEGGNMKRRVLRGGSWFTPPLICRSAQRNGGGAGYRNDSSLGFRVVAVSHQSELVRGILVGSTFGSTELFL